MPRGFSATALAITVTVILSSALIGWTVYSNSNTPKVKGVSSSGEMIRPGFSVDVVSHNGTWELYVLLCEKKDTCVESLDSGVRWLTRGGGNTSDSEVFVEAKDSWERYDHIKVFVRSGWGSSERKFSASKENVPVEFEIEDVQDVQAILLPVDDLMSDFFKVAKFSD